MLNVYLLTYAGDQYLTSAKYLCNSMQYVRASERRKQENEKNQQKLLNIKNIRERNLREVISIESNFYVVKILFRLMKQLCI